MPEPDVAGLRVGLVLGQSTGGIGRHVRSLADGLVSAGVEVSVAGPGRAHALFAFPAFVELPSPWRSPVPVVQAVRDLRRLPVDLLHAHGLRAGALAVLARRGRPVVVTWHNAQLSRRLGPRLEELVARRSAVTLAASEDLAVRAREAGGRDVRFAPVAAALQEPTGRDPGLGHPLVLAVGRLDAQKGYDVLLEALPRLGDVTVAVAGDGPLEASLRAAAPVVRWLGHRTDVADLLEAADVVVLPSVWEARALVAQEAMRAGRPLVASNVGGLPGLVRDGGILVPPGDPGALADAVRRVLDDPALAADLGQRARRVAATWPTPADTVAQVAGVYAELLRP